MRHGKAATAAIVEMAAVGTAVDMVAVSATHDVGRAGSRNANRVATTTVGIVRARVADAGTGEAGTAVQVVAVAAVGTSRTSNSHSIRGRQRSLCPMA